MRITLLFLALVCAAGLALAADVTGSWKGQLTTSDGEKMDVQYTFKQDGGKLTGTVLSPQGETLELLDGKVEGDSLTFVVEIKMNGGMKVPHSGKIVGDGIELQLSHGGEPMKVKLVRARNSS
jgi:hypothetical protein